MLKRALQQKLNWRFPSTRTFVFCYREQGFFQSVLELPWLLGWLPVWTTISSLDEQRKRNFCLAGILYQTDRRPQAEVKNAYFLRLSHRMPLFENGFSAKLVEAHAN